MTAYYACMFELYLFLLFTLVSDICNLIAKHKPSENALALKNLCIFIAALMFLAIIITDIILFGVLLISYI